MKEKKIWRLPPCSGLDIERLESWLTDMAAEGLHLHSVKKSWFCFVKGEAKAVRYRLEPGRGGLDDDLPEADAREMFRALGWEAVTAFGLFFIFRGDSSGAPELNTDSEVQLLAIKKMRRKVVAGSVISLLVLPLLIIWWPRQAEPFRFIITFGLLPSLFMVASFFLAVVESVIQLVQANAIVRKLKNDRCLDHSKPWRKGAWYHRLAKLTGTAAYWLFLAVMLIQFVSSLGFGGTTLENYNGDPPFVTVGDLLPEGKYSSDRAVGGYDRFVQYASDCAPRSIEWYEYARVETETERYDGALIVHYHETVAPWIARGLAEEYYRIALKEKYNSAIAPPELDADFVAAYTFAGMPTLVMQKGNVVITAFVGVEKDGAYVLQQWAENMLEMLNE